MDLDIAIKYYSNLADDFRRKASPERNDYMDLKDLATEHEQLADWLNELKILREKVRTLLEKDRWIPVTESEPTETGLYLVTENTVVERKWTTRMRIAKCEVSKLHDGRVDVCWRGFGGRVLAWRPLPELYTEEE